MKLKLNPKNEELQQETHTVKKLKKKKKKKIQDQIKFS